MSSRYFTNALIAVLAGTLVVFTQSLSSSAVMWTGLGIAIVVLVVSLLAQLDTDRGIAQRALDGVMGITSVALIVFTAGTFSGGALVWLVFAFALGFVGVAITGLTLHEIENWRAAHNLGQLHWLAPETERSTERVAA